MVSNAWEGRAEGKRRKLVQVNWDDALGMMISLGTNRMTRTGLEEEEEIRTHAPWTKNCIMKPEAERPCSLLGKIHAGIMAADKKALTIMVLRLPKNCER